MHAYLTWSTHIMTIFDGNDHILSLKCKTISVIRIPIPLMPQHAMSIIREVLNFVIEA